MAKLINGLLGNSRNKVGNLVTYVSKGQQIARSKAANIANPRTEAQMEQRTKMANLVNFYRANKVWADKLAFANKPQRWSTWNAFVHANIGKSQVYLTKTEASAGAVVAAPYIVTGGSLPAISINQTTTPGLYQTDLYLGGDNIPQNMTVGQFSSRLIANNNGLVAGMQLSLVENFQTFQNGVPKVTVRAYEVILNPDDDTPLASRISSLNFSIDQIGANKVVAYNVSESADVVAFTFILSHTTSNGTQVSPATLVLTNDTTYSSYTSDTQKQSAIDSYGTAAAAPFLDSTEQEIGSDGDVPLANSILSADLNSSGSKSPGQYIGSVGNDNAFTISVGLANAATAVTAAKITANGVEYNSTSIESDPLGQYWDVTFADNTVPSNAVITKITLTVDGQIINASFASSDSGVTE